LKIVAKIKTVPL